MLPASFEKSARPDPRRLLLVDGHAYAYRAFYAIRKLNAPDGRPTNAIFGFLKMLERMKVLVEPTDLAVVWDGGLAQERITALPGYKAQRPPMPDALASQLGEIQRWLAAARIVSCLRDGVEADDWIGTLAHRAEAAGWEVVIASSDKDFMQLVSGKVRLLNPGDKSERLWGRDEVVEKSGVEPCQIVDWLSLVGDSVDNIPGAPGVGALTAANLLKKFGSVSAIISELHQVTPERIRLALEASQEVLRRNQNLIRLKTDLDPSFGPELVTLACARGDVDLMIQLCAEWGFRSLRAELERNRAEPVLL